MNQPYTYLIICLPTNQWYYGVRYAKSCHPDEFWKKYFTSSEKVKYLIEKYGKEAFSFEIRKIFNSKEKALQWEKKVLMRMKIMKRSDCLNMAITGNTPYSQEAMKKANIQKYGVEYPFQSKIIQEKIKLKDKDYTKIQEKVQNTMQEKYGSHFLASNNFKDKMKTTFKEKYGVERVCDIPSVREKKKKLNAGKIWVKHSTLGQKRIDPYELDKYYELGYVKGVNNRRKERG